MDVYVLDMAWNLEEMELELLAYCLEENESQSLPYARHKSELRYPRTHKVKTVQLAEENGKQSLNLLVMWGELKSGLKSLCHKVNEKKKKP
jgi:hypothetical protein